MIKEKALQIINYYSLLAQLKYFQSEVYELTEAIIRENEADFNEGYTPNKCLELEKTYSRRNS